MGKKKVKKLVKKKEQPKIIIKKKKVVLPSQQTLQKLTISTLAESDEDWLRKLDNIVAIHLIGKSIIEDPKKAISVAEKYFSLKNEQEIKPFFEILMVYVLSSTSHIIEKYRITGMKILLILMRCYPSLVCEHQIDFTTINVEKDLLLECYANYILLERKENNQCIRLPEYDWQIPYFYNKTPNINRIILFKSSVENKNIGLGSTVIQAYWIEAISELGGPNIKICPALKNAQNCLVILQHICKDWKFYATHCLPKFPFGVGCAVSSDAMEIIEEMNLRLALILAESENEQIAGFINEYAGKTRHLHPIFKQVVSSMKKDDNLHKNLIAMDLRLGTFESFNVIKSILDKLDKPLLEKWIQSLPKKLWQLKNKNIELTNSILLVLLGFVKKFNGNSLVKMLSPLFHTTLAKGPVPGPILNWPDDLKRILLDIVYYVDWDLSLSTSLARACQDYRMKPWLSMTLFDMAKRKVNPWVDSILLSIVINDNVNNRRALEITKKGPLGLLFFSNSKIAVEIEQQCISLSKETDLFDIEFGNALNELVSEIIPTYTLLPILLLSRHSVYDPKIMELVIDLSLMGVEIEWWNVVDEYVTKNLTVLLNLYHQLDIKLVIESVRNLFVHHKCAADFTHIIEQALLRLKDPLLTELIKLL